MTIRFIGNVVLSAQPIAHTSPKPADAAEHETDKRAGRVARLFLRGRSEWELVFLRPGETAP